MRKVYATLAVDIILELDDDVPVSEILSEMQCEIMLPNEKGNCVITQADIQNWEITYSK